MRQSSSSPWQYPHAPVTWFKRDDYIYHDSLPLRPHLTPLAEKIFVRGQCHALAVALHEILGWSIYGCFRREGSDRKTYHYVVQCPGNNGWSMADVTGIHCVDCGHRRGSALAILANKNDAWLPPAMEFARHYAPMVVEKLKRDEEKFIKRWGRERCCFGGEK